MTLFLDALVAGVAIGSLYALIGVGYTVVYNATRVFNLAQGDLVMVGVMLSYLALHVLHLAQVLALLMAVAGVVVLSVFEERVVVRPFLGRGEGGIGWFIATLAFSLVIESAVGDIYGDRPPEAIRSFLPERAIHLGSVTISPQLVFVIAVLLLVVVALELFYRRTWTGRAMRATAEDREAAGLRGIDPNKVSVIAFALGGLAAGVGGFAIAPVVFSNVGVGLTYSLDGFLALAIGGFGSIRGAVVGGIALGIAEQVWDLYVDPRYELVAGMAVLMLVLSIRPVGLFGMRATRQV